MMCHTKNWKKKGEVCGSKTFGNLSQHAREHASKLSHRNTYSQS